jgi:hypothetical protein
VSSRVERHYSYGWTFDRYWASRDQPIGRNISSSSVPPLFAVTGIINSIIPPQLRHPRSLLKSFFSLLLISPFFTPLLTSTSFHRSNTAKVSSLLMPRAISFPPEVDTGPHRLAPDHNMSQSKAGRRRRSSSIIYQEPPESIEHTSDQAALPNLNANWVNAKGE